ncbi:MAG: alpha-glucan family phosphorylase [Bacteroidales bacterium]|nr:alpha-glucan family phosphorylase [Bacteroidales bacterium]
MIADYIFETAWEICNKVGGIHTVLSTKAATVVELLHDNYICIGPDLSKERSDDFIEDVTLYKNWRDVAQQEGLKIRVGRWRIVGSPVVVLVDFTPFFEKKNEILTQFWLKYKLDSISGQWDYIEPALFGYAAGRVIESFYNFYCNSMDRIVAHFHEWMTGTGILYLESATPQIATVFTTHATVLGRCIAGNGLPLYGDIHQYNPLETACRFGVQSKFSLEYLSAQRADVYTTVSDITNKECGAFFSKPADVITINGFEDDFVPQGEEYVTKRAAARKTLLHVASSLMQQQLPDDALLVINSGRFEFKNKGIDVFIKSLSNLSEQNPDRTVVAFLTVPAGNSGKREELLQKMEEPIGTEPVTGDFATHVLHDPYNDPILKALAENRLANRPDNNVKVVYVPVYLDGNDGIFNLSYYDLLIGFDLSVFPSYYEPWGYTPLESIAFGVPTITTSLAGFGLWVRDQFGEQQSIVVIDRDDNNDDEVVDNIVKAITFYTQCNQQTKENLNQTAVQISQKALWSNLYDNYKKAYAIALSKSELRFEQYQSKTANIGQIVERSSKETPEWHRIAIKSHLPKSLEKLEQLSENLWWSWNYEARELFEEIAGPTLWQECGENPVHLIQIIPLDRIEIFANNESYIQQLNKVYDDFCAYMAAPCTRPEKKIAYFSMEFGISNELKIFSGGLGMLAGDYLKEASDSNVNMIGVGLLYRYGYFTQQISAHGEQVNLYPPQSFSKLPITPLKDENGDWKKVSLALPGRTLYARIWRVDVGRIPLYLMDTDFDENWNEDRGVTATLYGGDVENRLKQEMLLGIGGMRMLNLLGEKPDLFHLNEGHAAFLSLERLHQIMQEKHVNLSMAAELVRASSLYTTHTPVPAGHDAFHEDLMRTYFANFPERFDISWETFMGFGRKREDYTNDKFSMSVLACHFSQEINGVSRIHGRVSREMFADLYEGRFAEESHIGYVTNGVHYPTWAHKKWQKLHHEVFGQDFAADRSNPKYWEQIKQVDDSRIWQIKQELRKEMFAAIKPMLNEQMRRRNESPSLISNTLKAIRDDVLTIGFARRFATYKRAHLLFTNEARLNQLLNDPEHPIQFVFAGKAHPHDKAGQDLITRIIELARKPEFVGKIIFVENYDMILAKKLVSGCDVWLNTPTRPLEASGTSGEKAVMNGVLNFSVLDGWWAEGYVPGAGWAINEQITYQDNRLQDELDAATLYSTIEEEIVPTFYTRNTQDIPAGWVQMMKKCFCKISPNYTMKRQLDDYYDKFYHKLEKRHETLYKDNLQNIRTLLRWKEKVIANWSNLRCVDISYQNRINNTFYVGERLEMSLTIKVGALEAKDLKVEMLFTEEDKNHRVTLYAKYPFTPVKEEGDTVTYRFESDAKDVGLWNCAIRIIPQNPLLPHDLDFNLVKWM